MKLQGLADDKLDGQIGVLRKLDAATGKFEVVLVDEACKCKMPERKVLTVSWQPRTHLCWSSPARSPKCDFRSRAVPVGHHAAT